MKFEIWRAKHIARNKQPCPDAVKEGKSWFVSFDTLEQFVAWTEALDSEIIFNGRDITIYDDYVE